MNIKAIGLNFKQPEKISNNEKIKENAETADSAKSKLKNQGKVLMLSLGCLASSAIAMLNMEKASVSGTKTSEQKPEPKDKGDKTPGTDGFDDPDFWSGDDEDDGPGPGYDGDTSIVMLQRVDGGIDEIYQLSDGRYIWPEDFHFPHGRSVDELAFREFPAPLLTVYLPSSIPTEGATATDDDEAKAKAGVDKDSEAKEKAKLEEEEIEILDELEEDDALYAEDEERQENFLFA